MVAGRRPTQKPVLRRVQFDKERRKRTVSGSRVIRVQGGNAPRIADGLTCDYRRSRFDVFPARMLTAFARAQGFTRDDQVQPRKSDVNWRARATPGDNAEGTPAGTPWRPDERGAGRFRLERSRLTRNRNEERR